MDKLGTRNKKALIMNLSKELEKRVLQLEKAGVGERGDG